MDRCMLWVCGCLAFGADIVWADSFRGRMNATSNIRQKLLSDFDMVMEQFSVMLKVQILATRDFWELSCPFRAPVIQLVLVG